MWLRSVLLLAMAVAGGALAQTSPAPGISGERLGPEEVEGLLIVAAHFYCANNRWPAAVSDILDYDQSVKVLPKTPLRRDHILAAAITYATEPSFLLRAPVIVRNKDKESLLVIKATQDAPTCKGKDITLEHAAMVIDADRPTSDSPGA